MPTAIFIPINAFAMMPISRKLSKNIEMTYMITNEGRVMPTVANKAPSRPFCLKPTKVAAFTAIGPGVDSAMTVMFIISS